MLQQAVNAQQSFTHCQGMFSPSFGRFPMAGLSAGNHTATDVMNQISVLREAMTELSVGLTQLAVALQDLEGRLPTRR